MQTALALRQAIWRKTDPAWPVCGLPAALYGDLGSDFTSDHMAQVCADVKVQLIHSTPGKPRGRGTVERLFGTITTELLPTLPGHIPPGNHGKPVTPPALSLSERRGGRSRSVSVLGAFDYPFVQARAAGVARGVTGSVAGGSKVL